MKKYTIILVLAIFMPLTAPAGELKKMRSFGDWDVYSMQEQDGMNVCHAIAKPYRTKVFYGVRNLPFVAITKLNGNYTLSTYPGFTLEESNPPVLSVDNKEIPLQVIQETHAATYSDISDTSIFNHMLGKYGNFTIHSQSRYNRIAIDIYSVYGLISALRYMGTHCHN